MSSTLRLDFKTAVAQEEARLRLLHPTVDDIPGCVSVFDDYLACNVIRSQVKSIYRFGERTKCDRKFQDFKFCISTKIMHPEERREAWIRRRAEWWAHRRLNKSSEDVWNIRSEPLEFPKLITPELMREAEVRT
ncbi:unnamed protein product [Cyclocybe aegerita]|uniref:Uncharacterized protein n=1 Tax=Cyclocybe aegerita TaxID=1973307 RepID=A0A8S0WCK0_CYCAE|nr:unnamed protein product [Cyclocybe aegerita]